MKLSRFAVHHPIFTLMLALIVILVGSISLARLPIDLMPDVTYPTLTVSASYGNASPEEMEELVTRPIEEALSAVPGVEEISSNSVEGECSVRVTFGWGTDLDAAANDVRDRIDRILPRLPEDAARPVLRKFDLASFPILIMGAYGELDPIQLRRVIDEQVKYRVERVSGVAALDVWGGLTREIHVNLDPEKVRSLGLPLDAVVARIAAENADIPAGTIERGPYEVTVRTAGSYASLDEIRDTAVAVRDGAVVRLREVANVQDSWARVRQIVRVNGKPGIRLAVNKQSGTNTVEVAQRVLEEIARINRDLPQLRLTPIIDTSAYIRRSITSVGSAALYGGGLAVLVLLFFLRDLRSTAVIASAIPLSVVATFALMYFSGYTLNIMTLGGLALGVGMLVDNSIVVLENIYRLRESGRPPLEAAVEGAEEVAAPVVASTLTTVVVFLPMLFVRGMTGVMFKQLSVVIGFALACSLAAALTVVPAVAARIGVAGSSAPGRGHFARVSEFVASVLERMGALYGRLLDAALRRRAATVGGALVLLGASAALFPWIGVEFMPATDESEVRISAEMDVGTRPEVVAERFGQIDAVVEREVGEARNRVVSVGGTRWGASGSHTGEMRIALVPARERSRSSEEIAAALRPALSRLPGTIVRTRAGQGLFILRMGSSSGDRLQIEIRGHDLERSAELAERVRREVELVEGVTDAQVSRQSGSPEEVIAVDREKASAMKVSVSQVAAALATAITGTRAGYYREAGDEYPIVVKLSEGERMALQDILDLAVASSDGEPIALRNLVETVPRRGPTRIERKDQERTVYVTANISGRDMGSVLADIRERLRSVPVPAGFSIVFGGDYEEQQKAFRELALSLALAVALVYMVMAAQYESLRDPFIVMFSVPFAAIGVLLVLYLTRTTFNVQSFIGCVMLAGIVVNNAIILVDHTNLLHRRDGLPMLEAIREAGRRRLRPILMTMLTTVLGLLPLAMGLGEGAEAQAPMARAVVGGLTSSSLVTLVFVPVVHSLLARRRADAGQSSGGTTRTRPASSSGA